MRVTALVLSWNAPQELRTCLQSLQQQRGSDCDVLVVDNGSVPSPAAWLTAEFPAVELVRSPFNRGFAGGMNLGLQRLAERPQPAQIAVLINQDTVLAADCLAELTAPLRNDATVAACGALIYYPDGRVQHAGVEVDARRATVRHRESVDPQSGPQECACLNGALLAIRTQINGQPLRFDEGYTPAYYEDIDLCARMRRAGGRLLLVPRAVVTHTEGLSTPDQLRRASLYHRGRLRYLFKHHGAAQLEDEFLPAELQHLAEHLAAPIEGRALRWAYDMTLSGLAELIAARTSDGTDTDEADRQRLQRTAWRLQQAAAQLWQQRHGG
jgi:GT2 family glycosyltransferase